MYREEITHYSHALERDMHIMIHGHGGMPLLCFPTQDSMCRNYEDFGEALFTQYIEEYTKGAEL